MSRWRFVHAADLHLDSPLAGLGEYPTDLAPDLLGATFVGFRRIVDLCLERDAAFLLLAGDLFDAPDRSLRAQLGLRRELERLTLAGLETFIVHGNHDHAGGDGVALEWPRGVTVFPTTQPEVAEVSRGGQTLARIWGLSHAGPRVADNLSRRFSPANPGDPFTIGLLHANLDHNPEHEDYAPCTLGDLARCHYDYWALGHIHRPAIRRPAQPAVIYAGNHQGRHFKESGPRGCYLVEVDGREVRPEFHATGAIRWEEAVVDLSRLERFDQVPEALTKALEGHRPDPPVQGAILRVSLTGRGRWHRELSHPAALPDLLEDLRHQGRSHRPWVWVEKIRADTRPEVDLTSLSRGADLLAATLRLLEDARTAPEPPGELQALLDPLYANPLAARYLDRPAPASELWDEVAAELITRLAPEAE